jgi:ATP-binding cassette subfamily G (WHITE) protein 2 (PDR)
LWRNLGFIAAFLLFFLALYLVVTEINSMNNDAGEVLVFRKGYAPKVVTSLTKISASPEESDENQIVVVDQEAQNNVFAHLSKKIDIFSWRDVTLDIKTKTGPRRLLDGVSGWVKPGTLTALMGVSGAGKTTLLNVLASRSSLGIVSPFTQRVGADRMTTMMIMWLTQNCRSGEISLCPAILVMHHSREK